MAPAPITLAFVHEGKAFLPELEGYQRYFGERGIRTLVLHPRELKRQPVDIEWHMMGTHFRRTNPKAVVIHEYASPSIPPFASLKNRLKKSLNCLPDYRLFLNQATAEEMNFSDQTPFGYRDMFVVDRSGALQDNIRKEFDFIYMGSLESARRPELLLDRFASGPLRSQTILVLSKDYSHLKRKYSEAKNIEFAGPINPTEVGGYIQKARFGLDYRPLYKPYTIQTSSKLLEYLSQKVPPVCSRTIWVESFQKQYGGRFFMIDEDMDNLTMNRLEDFRFEFPDLSEWTLTNQLTKSGVLTFLNNRFNTESFTP